MFTVLKSQALKVHLHSIVLNIWNGLWDCFSGKDSDKIYCDLGIFEQQISEYIEWLKLDPNKSLARKVTRLCLNTFRKRIVQ